MAKIVIVDDSRLARTFTASCLKKLEHEVEMAEPTGIFDVVKVLKEHKADLLIMDFLMPNCPGASLAKVVREDPELKGMRTIVLTAHHDEEVVSRLKGLGVAEVLFKPADPETLVRAVTAVLATRT
jgi:two-component system chemotaxis response regulator CheY